MSSIQPSTSPETFLDEIQSVLQTIDEAFGLEGFEEFVKLEVFRHRLESVLETATRGETCKTFAELRKVALEEYLFEIDERERHTEYRPLCDLAKDDLLEAANDDLLETGKVFKAVSRLMTLYDESVAVAKLDRPTEEDDGDIVMEDAPVAEKAPLGNRPPRKKRRV
ncbi:hypothetical protein NliqN6_6343 [Naganishia liquefaciens]|uniref:Uncharacterized protein n=1 Tax=Naganishia liquefaciens TaxID=104408 RepID=A0A8H3TYG3_9TREE|nr:hypothetical protein NliqN6_6343 [Naganishia liquefaciens]